MRSFIRQSARVMFLGILMAAGASCGDSTAPTGATVSIEDDLFDPSAVAISAGEKVVWTWNGANQHNVTWDAAGPASSGTLTTGTFEQTFSTAGSFPYHCTVHTVGASEMRGTVTVN